MDKCACFSQLLLLLLNDKLERRTFNVLLLSHDISSTSRERPSIIASHLTCKCNCMSGHHGLFLAYSILLLQNSIYRRCILSPLTLLKCESSRNLTSQHLHHTRFNFIYLKFLNSRSILVEQDKLNDKLI